MPQSDAMEMKKKMQYHDLKNCNFTLHKGIFFLETKINFMQISSAMRFSILKQKKKRKTLMMKEEEGEGRNHGIWQECLL